MNESLSNEEKEVLQALKKGGSLRYFFLQGCVAVHTQNDTPDDGHSCSIQAFVDLSTKGLIDQTDGPVGGYPYYADSHKSNVYNITNKGEQALLEM